MRLPPCLCAVFVAATIVAECRELLGEAQKLKLVSKQYNRQLQQHCGNPEFVEKNDDQPVAKIFHGKPVEPGKYPWAVAIAQQISTWCGGTLISKRHIVTARHCFKENDILKNAPYIYLKVYAGGVCHRKGKDCPSADMRELEWDFAAYEYDPPGDGPVFKEHDIAIIQLKEDVSENDTSIRPICLSPPGSTLKERLNVYGWGLKEDGKASERLLEVELRMATEKDELYRAYADRCKNQHFFCLLPVNATTRQDGAKGDSGSGIVAEFGSTNKTYFLQGFSDQGPKLPNHMDIGLNIEKYLYDLCFYTGVCAKPEWEDMADETNLTIRLNAAWDQSDRDPNAKVPQSAIDGLREEGENAREIEEEAEFGHGAHVYAYTNSA